MLNYYRGGKKSISNVKVFKKIYLDNFKLQKKLLSRLNPFFFFYNSVYSDVLFDRDHKNYLVSIFCSVLTRYFIVFCFISRFFVKFITDHVIHFTQKYILNKSMSKFALCIKIIKPNSVID